MREWLLPPNLLTLARLALTPFIGLSLARGDARAAFPLIFIAALTDAIDGYLARRFHWQSALGEKLDPVADKLMLAVVYLGLGAAGVFPHWLIALILGRDALILLFAAAAFTLTSIRRLPPTIWGKLSTICQMGLAAAALLSLLWPSDPLKALVEFGIQLTALATLWSALHYALTGWRLWRGSGAHAEPHAKR